MQLLKRILLGLLVIVAVGLTALFVTARFSDGPMEIIAGGPFSTGELQTGPEPDWSFIHDTQEVQFQLLDPERSRTTWVVEHKGKAYIPSGYMTTWWGKLWKHWPHEALEDGRILLRVGGPGGKIWERQLVRVDSGPELQPILDELSRKYAGGSEFGPEVVTSGYLWLFELAPRR